jgi:hypothetical protein
MIHFDPFFWAVLPVALLEGVRTARNQLTLGRRTLAQAVGFGALDFLLLALCGALNSTAGFIAAAIVHVAAVCVRERGLWMRGLLKVVLVLGAGIALVAAGAPDALDALAKAGTAVDPWRTAAVVALVAAVFVSIVPVRIADETKETLAAPLTLIAFARIGVPLLGADEVVSDVVVTVGLALATVCALWLLSAALRVNHFERSTLVSEIVACVRGVLLAGVWIGMSANTHLAGVGAFLAWWSAALSLLALEAALRVMPLPKGAAFFAFGIAIGVPGTTGFVAEDLLAHGLLVDHPGLAAVFVVVTALHAVGLYLAIVHTASDDLRLERPVYVPGRALIVPALLSLMIGLMPRAFVSAATAARQSIEGHAEKAAGHGS